MSSRSSRGRAGATLAVATAAVVVFGAVGGTGLAGGLAKPVRAQYGPGQYQYTAKVMICHKGKVTINVGVAAMPAHLRHGDAVGACAVVPTVGLSSARAAKAAKAAKATKSSKAAKSPKSTPVASPVTTVAPSTGAPAPSTGKGNGNGRSNGKKG